MTANPAETTLQRFLDANGGADRWQALTAREYRAHVHQFPPDPDRAYTCVIGVAPPARYRRDVRTRAQTIVQVTNGVETWLSVNGQPPIAQRGPAAERFADQRDKEIPFLDWRAKGFSLHADGTETLNGHSCLRLIITQRTGALREMLIDADTWLWRAERLITPHPHGPQVVLQVFHDHTLIDGLRFPMRVDRWIDGAMVERVVIESMTVNVPFPPGWFERPIVESSSA